MFIGATGLLETVGLADRWDAYPAELSGGQQRRVAIARALINEPPLLLADEPTSDLDEQTEREIFALLLDLHLANDTTLLLVTHNVALAEQTDQVIYLEDNGRIVSTTQLSATHTIATSAVATSTVLDAVPAPPVAVPSASSAPRGPTSPLRWCWAGPVSCRLRDLGGGDHLGHDGG